MRNKTITISLFVVLTSAVVIAYPTQVTYVDGPQDPLFVPLEVHELGTPPGFVDLPDELIEAVDTFTDLTVCFDPLTPDDTAIPNTLVRMTNLTGVAWREVWYVADTDETLHSNYDGWVAGTTGITGTAFRIDSKVTDPLGVHNPLVFESIAANGIFEPGETWDFVIQDYSNALGKPASALGSIGVPSAFATDVSSGSIIAVAVPEPATLALLGLGGILLRRKRSI
jgi:hypothetical protein